MSNLVLIFVSLILGFLIRRTEKFPLSTPQSLNSFVIFVSLPSLVLLQITELLKTFEFRWNYLLPVSMPWIIFLMSWLFFSRLGKFKNWSKERIGALILISGLGNTSFVGIPLLEGIVGPDAVAWGVLIDQLGSFLVLSTLGLFVATQFGRSKTQMRTPLKQTFTFPPFIALLTAMIFGAFDFSFTGDVKNVLERLSQTLVPLALFSVGFQLRLNLEVLKKLFHPLIMSLVFKLIFCPMLFTIICLMSGQEFDLVTRVMILEAAMATMITSAVIVSEFSMDEELANLMVGISILFSLVTVPIWDKLISLL